MIKINDNDFVISDLHLTHKNIIKYCKRPYEMTEEGIVKMEEDILSLYDKLPINCTIWNLGDLMDTKVHTVEEMKPIVDRMRGPTGERKLYLLLGNHDISTLDKSRIKFYYEIGFNKVYDTPIVVNEKFILSHEPVYIPSGSSFVNIYGHTHDKDVKEDSFQYDWDEYNGKCKQARKSGLPEPELIKKYPDKIVDTDKNYINVCYDHNYKFLSFRDIFKRFA